jgi:hypothetical protein
MNGSWKFFAIEVNPLAGGECDSFVAFQTLDPTAQSQQVEKWVWEGSHRLSFGLRLDEDEDNVLVTELTKEEFCGLTLGQITGHVIDNARYPKPAVSVA